jgi:hypothetical protein
MLPLDWTENSLDHAAWIEDLAKDERGLNKLCACVLYTNFRIKSAATSKGPYVPS